MIKTFDAIVIGAGQAGPSLAGRLTGAGMSVALIERKLIGGTCVNTGCTPTKTLIASAYAAQMARRASDYGLTIGGAVGVDMKRVKARKDAVSGNSRTGLASLPAITLMFEICSPDTRRRKSTERPFMVSTFGRRA